MTAEETRQTTEAARQQIWRAYFGIQLAVQHPEKEPPPNMLAALDAFEAAIREQERQRYRELVEAARAAGQLAEDIAAHIDDLGGSGGDTVITIATTLRAALAAIEQEGRS